MWNNNERYIYNISFYIVFQDYQYHNKLNPLNCIVVAPLSQKFAPGEESIRLITSLVFMHPAHTILNQITKYGSTPNPKKDVHFANPEKSPRERRTHPPCQKSVPEIDNSLPNIPPSQPGPFRSGGRNIMSSCVGDFFHEEIQHSALHPNKSVNLFRLINRIICDDNQVFPPPRLMPGVVPFDLSTFWGLLPIVSQLPTPLEHPFREKAYALHLSIEVRGLTKSWTRVSDVLARLWFSSNNIWVILEKNKISFSII